MQNFCLFLKIPNYNLTEIDFHFRTTIKLSKIVPTNSPFIFNNNEVEPL